MLSEIKFFEMTNEKNLTLNSFDKFSKFLLLFSDICILDLVYWVQRSICL